MGGPILESILLFLLILANGVLAMAEIAVVSARQVRLQHWAETGDEGAKVALDLARDPSDFLSTVQVGITLVGILSGAFGGATLADRLAPWLVNLPFVGQYSQLIAFGIVVLVITYLSLVIGELAPKRLALTNAERVAAAVAKPMNWLANLMSPLVYLLSRSSDLVLVLLGARSSGEPPVTEDEVKVLVEMGARSGVFEQAESEMVAGVFRLAGRRVDSLMTPRTDIAWLDVEDTPEETRQKIIESVHSRLPVARGDLDHILGVVQAKGLLARCLSGGEIDLASDLIPAQFVPESTPALKVLDLFRQSRVHIALVIDEYGGLQGLLTIIDILEAIVGEIPLSGELNEPEVVQRADGSWLLDGMLPVDEFKDYLRISELPLEGHGYQTVGGLVMAYLGRIPHTGDQFEWNGHHFEILDMDGFRVDKVLVVPDEADQAPE